MSTVQELYDSSIRPLEAAERMRLAQLILRDLVVADRPVESSDEWSDEDLADVSAFAVTRLDGRSS